MRLARPVRRTRPGWVGQGGRLAQLAKWASAATGQCATAAAAVVTPESDSPIGSLTQLRHRTGTLSGQILDYEGHKAAKATSRASTGLNLASLESNRSMRHSRLGALQVVSYATTPVPVTREGAGANFGHIAQPLPLNPSDS